MMNEAAAVRPLPARWVVTAELTLLGAAHLGGVGDEPGALCRDGLTGAPLLTGTALAGALRAGLAARRAGAADDGSIARLFGAASDGPGGASALTVGDSVGVLPEGGVERLGGLALDPAGGLAAAGGPYSFEALPRGTRFPMRFELAVAADEHEAALTGALAMALDGLNGDVRIGARRSRGLGAVRAGAWRAVRFDLASAAGWREWLLTDPARPVPDWVAAHPNARAALRDGGAQIGEARFEPDGRMGFWARLDLRVDGSLLVPGSADEAGRSTEPARAGDRYVWMGGTLAGALRARAARIAGVVRAEQGDGERWVRRLFGSPSGDGRGTASRLSVSASLISEGARLRGGRAAIDRFTGGLTHRAPAREEAAYAGHLAVMLQLPEPRPGEEGLLLLLVRDLVHGELPVGGTAGLGRGVLRGTVDVGLADGVIDEFGDAQVVSSGGRAALETAVEAFWSAAALEEDGG